MTSQSPTILVHFVFLFLPKSAWYGSGEVELRLGFEIPAPPLVSL